MDTRKARRAQRLQELTRRAMTATSGHLDVEPEPERERPARWSLTLKVAGALSAAVVLILGIVLLRGWLARPPEAVPLTDPNAATASTLADGELAAEPSGQEAADSPRRSPPSDQDDAASQPDATDGTVVVHVAGAVHRPGIVELDAASRLHQALDAAGGATEAADLDALNLAQLVSDGERVYVPAEGETPPPPPPGSTPATEPGGAGQGANPGAPIDLNTATSEELQTLSGIGPALAERIIAHRTDVGPFTSVDQLQDVSGIGPAIMDRIRDDASVGP